MGVQKYRIVPVFGAPFYLEIEHQTIGFVFDMSMTFVPNKAKGCNQHLSAIFLGEYGPIFDGPLDSLISTVRVPPQSNVSGLDLISHDSKPLCRPSRNFDIRLENLSPHSNFVDKNLHTISHRKTRETDVVFWKHKEVIKYTFQSSFQL